MFFPHKKHKHIFLLENELAWNLLWQITLVCPIVTLRFFPSCWVWKSSLALRVLIQIRVLKFPLAFAWSSRIVQPAVVTMTMLKLKRSFGLEHFPKKLFEVMLILTTIRTFGIVVLFLYVFVFWTASQPVNTEVCRFEPHSDKCCSKKRISMN